jgi:hypothetical protein
MRTGRLKIFRTCRNLVRELGLYHYDAERNLPVDLPVKEHDHCPDALRYCISRIDRVKEAPGLAPRPAQPEPEPEPPRPDPQTDYRISPPQDRYRAPQPPPDQTERQRRKQRDHLWNHPACWEDHP